jgi:hypothetical protein
MSIRPFLSGLFIFGLFIATAVGAQAADLAFSTSLRGDAAPTATGSKATGTVTIVVHTDAQTVDIAANISGITPDRFAHHLAHAPVGPMHLHIYQADGNVSLLLPFPLSDAYVATSDGFTYTRKGYGYAEGAAILKSTIAFDAFVAAMKGGAVVFNIHTEAFPDGEISGTVVPAK